SLNLWHHRGDRRFRPIYEEDFSDYLKNHFLDDLTSDIIIHREVVIDPSSRTDIFIDLINNESNLEENRIISVIIEIKCSWHNELDTAMETQLCEQYMITRGYRYGMYLVGWFTSQYWDLSCNRYSETPGAYNSIEDLRNYLQIQAESLSNSGISIRSSVIDCSLNEIRTGTYR
ncbi:hypothetical protein LCGC14_2428040, partial [marine sediment metagenome]